MEEGITDRVNRIHGKGKNALVRNKYVAEYLDSSDVALDYPQPVKPRLIRIYRRLGGAHRDHQLQPLTIPQIEDLILGLGKRPVIAFDHFENISPGAAQSYYRLHAEGGFRFIVSQHRAKIRYYGDVAVRRFFKTFKLANPEYRKGQRVEVDLTPAVILLASLTFLAYFFKALAMAERSPNTFYTAAISAFWVVFLTVRTIIYIIYAHLGAGGRRRY